MLTSRPPVYLKLKNISAPFSNSCRRLKYKPALPPIPSVSTLPPPRIDYHGILENAEYHTQNIKNRKTSRNGANAVNQLQELYPQYLDAIQGINRARAAQNAVGERVRLATSDKDKRAALQEAKELKDFLHIQEPVTAGIQKEVLEVALRIPNSTHPSSPVGSEVMANVLSTHGPKNLETHISRDHCKVSDQLGIVDFDTAAVVTGTSWYYLRDLGALLELALTNYAFSVAIKHGYTPYTTPDVIKGDIAFRCGFNPRDSVVPGQQHVHHLYHIEQSSNDLVLAGTAEIPLAGMFANHIFMEKKLPVRAVALGHAFRSEAGARGALTKGLYRVHQFTKVELFSVTEPDQSESMMEELKEIQIELYNGLGFPFRVLDMPTEELGHAAFRKYDMEAWMPGRGTWGEISSTSNCTDFQARRLLIRYRPGDAEARSPSHPPQQKGLPFVHTLNGTAAAIPRLIVALVENGVQLDSEGNISALALPKALHRFWLGEESYKQIPITWFDP